MASEGHSPPAEETAPDPQEEPVPTQDAATVVLSGIKQSQSRTPDPEPSLPAAAQDLSALDRRESPDNLAELEPFSWEDFEKRYEQALAEADQREASVLEQAEQLSKYFKVWASTASAHDNERAVKRLRSQSRYVNMAEANTVKKQEHYEQVINAFESALALLRSQ